MKGNKNTVNWLSVNGVKMSKKVSSGGLFHSDICDTRVATTFDDISNLTRAGFTLDDADINTWNMVKLGIMNDVIELAEKIDKIEEKLKLNP